MTYKPTIANSVEQEFWDIYYSIPEKIRKIQGILVIDPFKLAENYFEADTVADTSIDPNANVSGKAPVNFQSEIFKPQLKLRSYYELWRHITELYGREKADKTLVAILNGLLYFHDITKIDIPYCFAFDTSFLTNFGRPYGWLPGKAPTRSSSFIGQLVETTMDLSQEHAGAIGLANALVNLAYYTKNERAELHRVACRFEDVKSATWAVALYAAGLGFSGNGFVVESGSYEDIESKVQSYLATGHTICEAIDVVYDKYIENLIQQFVHVMHNTFRVGGDSPFSNLSLFDSFILEDMFSDQIYPDLTSAGNNKEEIMKVQKIFIEFFVKGAPTTGKNYRFPVATINIKTFSNKDWEKGLCKAEQIGKIADEDFFEYVMKLNLPRGTFNIHVGEKIASCCRLTSDLADLKDQIQMDSFGNGGISIGSHRVVAVNLHRVALLYRDEKIADPVKNAHLDFIVTLKPVLEMAEMALVAHKHLLKERVENGFLKFFNIGWQNLNMFFSTIGYTGLWEMFDVLAMAPPEHDLELYVATSKEVLGSMEEYARDAGRRNEGYAFNVEEIPAENASPKLAMMDNFYYENKEWYTHVELLSNQMIPLYVNVDLFDRLKAEGQLMSLVSGGAILHLNINETMTEENYIAFNRRLIEEFGIVHYAINKGTTTCVNGHTSIGIHQECPVCGGAIDTHTIRVVGFNTDVKDWIKNRRDWEWKVNGRQFYLSKDILQ